MATNNPSKSSNIMSYVFIIFVVGAILFAALRVGLIVLGVDTFYQFIATGLVIIVAAYIEVVQNRFSSKLRRSGR